MSMFDWQRAGFARADFDTGRIRAFLDGLGRPQDRLRVIHIAGSKGKGSTAALLARYLTSGNAKVNLEENHFRKCKVGVFSSPFLFDEREMITINGEMIARDDLDRLLDDVRDLTYFEAMTAAAFRYFDEQLVDYAIMECGLGGLHDATNVCAKPVLTVLTRIEKEHTDYFGNRIADIVTEKCGILRKGVPLSCFDSGQYVNARIRECAGQAGAPVIGFFDSNERVALEAVDSICHCERSEAIPVRSPRRLLRRSLTLAPRNDIGFVPLSDSILQGRFQIVERGGITWVFDVAHTPASATYLRARLDERFSGKSIVFLLAFLKDKNVGKIVRALVRDCDGAVFTEVDHPRALKVHLLPVRCAPMKNREYALAKAVRDARKQDRIVCVSGSFETVKAFFSVDKTDVIC